MILIENPSLVRKRRLVHTNGLAVDAQREVTKVKFRGPGIR